MFLEKKCSLKGRTMLLVDLTRALLNLEKLYPFQKFIKIEHPLEIFFALHLNIREISSQVFSSIRINC